MEITGTLVTHLPVQTGISKKGSEWTKRSFVIQPPGQYAKPVPIEAFGDKFDVLDTIAEGEEITVHFNLDGSEYNGRWYVKVSAWKIDVSESGASSGGSEPKIEKQKAPPGSYKVADLSFVSTEDDESNDLPF